MELVGPRMIAIYVGALCMLFGNLHCLIQLLPSLKFLRHHSMSVYMVHLISMHNAAGRAHSVSNGPRDLYWIQMNACKGVLHTEKNYYSWKNRVV